MAMGRKSPSAVAVFLRDETQWQGAVFDQAGDGPACRGPVRQGPPAGIGVPVELLDWAEQEGVDSVLALVPTEVSTLSISLPRGLKGEERHSALAWELASTTGLQPEQARICSLNLNEFPAVEALDQVLASAVSYGTVQQWDTACRQRGLVLGGIGSLALAALCLHLEQNPPGQGFLLLGKSQSFAFAPPAENRPLMARTTPVGCQAEQDDWEGRFRRRLRALQGRPVQFLSLQGLPGGMEERIQELLSAPALHATPWEDAAVALMLQAARAHAEPGRVQCPMAGLPRVNRAPQRIMTLVAVLMILGTAVGAFVYYHMLNRELDRLTAWRGQAQLLEERRTAVRYELDALRRQLREQQDMRQLLSESKRLTGPFLPALQALQKVVLPGMRISQVIQRDGSVIVSGETVDQSSVATLGARLQEELKEQGVHVVPESVAHASHGGEGPALARFRLRLSKR